MSTLGHGERHEQKEKDDRRKIDKEKMIEERI